MYNGFNGKFKYCKFYLSKQLPSKQLSCHSLTDISISAQLALYGVTIFHNISQCLLKL